jgi:hypothetical protein
MRNLVPLNFMNILVDSRVLGSRGVAKSEIITDFTAYFPLSFRRSTVWEFTVTDGPVIAKLY